MTGCVVWELNSLILTGRTLRTFSAVLSDCLPLALVHEASATKSPLKAACPEVTSKVAPTMAPGATGSGNVLLPEATAAQPLGAERLSLTFVAGASVVFVNVAVVSCEDPGVKVCSPGGVAAADAGARLTAGTADLAATMLA